MPEFKDYQAFVESAAYVPENFYDSADRTLPVYAGLKLAGEAGEVSELIGKAMRPGGKLDVAEAILELGDVVWYVARIARILGTDLETVAELNTAKLEYRRVNGKAPLVELALARELLAARGVR